MLSLRQKSSIIAALFIKTYPPIFSCAGPELILVTGKVERVITFVGFNCLLSNNITPNEEISYAHLEFAIGIMRNICLNIILNSQGDEELAIEMSGFLNGLQGLLLQSGSQYKNTSWGIHILYGIHSLCDNLLTVSSFWSKKRYCIWSLASFCTSYFSMN